MTLAISLVLALSFAQAPPTLKPGPEHKQLAADAGTWDGVLEMMVEPGKPPIKGKGVEVNTIGCGGLCLITDFKSDSALGPFHGHGVTTWDPKKKKFIGSWTDSMSTGLAIGESVYDAKAKRWTGTMEGPDATGAVVKMKTVTDNPSPTSRVFTIYAPGPDGKEMQVMKVTYTRRK